MAAMADTDRPDAVVLDARLETVIRDYFDLPPSAIVDDVSTLDGDLRVTVLEANGDRSAVEAIGGVDMNHPSCTNCGRQVRKRNSGGVICSGCMAAIGAAHPKLVTAADDGREEHTRTDTLLGLALANVVLGLADIARLVLAVVAILAVLFAVLALAGVVV